MLYQRPSFTVPASSSKSPANCAHGWVDSRWNCVLCGTKCPSVADAHAAAALAAATHQGLEAMRHHMQHFDIDARLVACGGSAIRDDHHPSMASTVASFNRQRQRTFAGDGHQTIDADGSPGYVPVAEVQAAYRRIVHSDSEIVRLRSSSVTE